MVNDVFTIYLLTLNAFCTLNTATCSAVNSQKAKEACVSRITIQAQVIYKLVCETK